MKPLQRRMPAARKLSAALPFNRKKPKLDPPLSKTDNPKLKIVTELYRLTAKMPSAEN
jgi:hypothetical protein